MGCFKKSKTTCRREDKILKFITENITSIQRKHCPENIKKKILLHSEDTQNNSHAVVKGVEGRQPRVSFKLSKGKKKKQLWIHMEERVQDNIWHTKEETNILKRIHTSFLHTRFFQSHCWKKENPTISVLLLYPFSVASRTISDGFHESFSLFCLQNCPIPEIFQDLSECFSLFIHMQALRWLCQCTNFCNIRHQWSIELPTLFCFSNSKWILPWPDGCRAHGSDTIPS